MFSWRRLLDEMIDGSLNLVRSAPIHIKYAAPSREPMANNFCNPILFQKLTGTDTCMIICVCTYMCPYGRYVTTQQMPITQPLKNLTTHRHTHAETSVLLLPITQPLKNLTTPRHTHAATSVLLLPITQPLKKLTTHRHTHAATSVLLLPITQPLKKLTNIRIYMHRIRLQFGYAYVPPSHRLKGDDAACLTAMFDQPLSVYKVQYEGYSLA